MSQGHHCKRMTPPPVTIGGRDLGKNQSARALASLDKLVGPSEPSDRLGAPRVRAECINGPRPCPWASCRHHLAVDVTGHGGLRITWPMLQIGEVLYSCALDVTDDYPAGLTQDQVGALLNLSHERIRQIELRLQRKLRAAFADYKPEGG